MKFDEKLKLFISYAYEDESFIDEFQNHIIPLKDNEGVEVWCDRELSPGDNLDISIQNNLKNADVICLFISANFLKSQNCKREKEEALTLLSQKLIPVIPIILSPCGWLDDKYI